MNRNTFNSELKKLPEIGCKSSKEEVKKYGLFYLKNYIRFFKKDKNNTQYFIPPFQFN